MRIQVYTTLVAVLTCCGRFGGTDDDGADAKSPTSAAQGLCQKARRLESDGAYAPARKAYEACVREGGGFVDSHLGYQRILAVEEGSPATREAYETLRKEQPGPMIEWAAARLQDRDERVKRLDALITVSPEFTLAYYELSRAFSADELGSQSLDDQAREKMLLREFLSRAQGETSYREFFTDYEVAAQMLRDAESRLEKLASVDLSKRVDPVSVMAMPSNAGWHLTFKFEEVATSVQSRKRGDREFTQGWTLKLPLRTGKETVEVKYKDARGEWHGPYELDFDPAKSMVTFVKQTLEQVGPENWIAVQAPTGVPNLYFTTLFTYRCGITKVEYGVDVEKPNRTKPLPECDLSDPYAIRDMAGMFEPVPEGTRFISLRLTFADGETTKVHQIRVKK